MFTTVDQYQREAQYRVYQVSFFYFFFFSMNLFFENATQYRVFHVLLCPSFFILSPPPNKYRLYQLCSFFFALNFYDNLLFSSRCRVYALCSGLFHDIPTHARVNRANSK